MSIPIGGPCKLLPQRLPHAVERYTGVPDHSFRANNFEFRIFDSSVYAFRVLRNGTVFEDEYFVLDVQGMGEVNPEPLTGFPNDVSYVSQSLISKIDMVTKHPTQDIFYLTATAAPKHGKAEIIFNLDRDTVGLNTLKYGSIPPDSLLI